MASLAPTFSSPTKILNPPPLYPRQPKKQRFNKKNPLGYTYLIKNKNLHHLILSIFLLLLSFSLHGQNYAIKAGLNAANVTGEMVDLQWGSSFPTNYQTNFYLEAAVEYSLSSNFSIQSGLKYNGKGHRHYSQATNYFLNLSYFSEVAARLYYLDIPVTLKMRIPKVGCETYVFGGGYLGVGLHGERISINTFPNRNTEKFERSVEFGDDKGYKRMDFGGLLGVGMHFGSLFFEVSYTLGLPDLSTDPNFGSFENRNRLLSISLGYRFIKKVPKNNN